ncbi:type I polyketide synthase [Actinokineospora inagensis]|uniref:type I polyketide synthase n=1 Tax=Actinokineospora inagensis TaxID=103730 RepID=UPI0003FE6037|nr:type I polyketide synthase [Actinokineospora inagensis]
MTDYDALLRRALARIEELETDLKQARARAPEPVAVVGIGCRFPGADGPDEFWRLLVEGGDAITEVPPDRWDIDAYYDPDPDRPGKMNTRHGGFVPNPGGFDTAAFGISAREAASIDPQQRMLLEVAWRAFEHAGMPVRDLTERTGVYVGISNVDYREAMVVHGDDSIDGYFSSGSTTSTASGRLSYFLGLTGPSLSVDTACSSSSVAVHLAVRDLRSGACDVAVAGGVNQILTPHETISLSKARMMAPDGRCKPFAATANGYVRAEGCGMIVLKRLSDAQRDGDTVLALVLGSATNQDGRRSGLTVPHGPSQQVVIRDALRDAGVRPGEVGFVETHGTGTALGDPIETGALGAVFGERDRPLVLGAVKSNLGHLESAAGIAGVIKTVLALRYGVIPPNLHFTEPSPFVDWSLPITVPTAVQPWPDERRVAGASSFGFSGSNCHIVLAAAEPTAAARPEQSTHVVTLSAASPTALQAAQANLAKFAEDSPAALADIAFTANTRRSHFEHRAAIVADTTADLATRTPVTGYAPSAPKVAFLFTGQGSQYPGMGKAVEHPVFTNALTECAELLDRPLWSLLDGPDLDRTEHAQPALFAVEYALTQLWRSWGVVPDAVLGHSVGEFVAACVAGVFSLADGLRLVMARGRLMQALPDGGVMISLRGGHDLVDRVVAEYPLVSVAAVNGPTEIVISGDGTQARAAAKTLAEQGVTGRELRVSHAFHSPLMRPIVDEFAKVVESITFAPPKIPIAANVTGRLDTDLTDPGYWVRQALEPVLFADGLRALGDVDAFVEIGPQPVLLGLGRAVLTGDHAWLPSLRKTRVELAAGVAELYVRGARIDWPAFTGNHDRVDLPGYPFQRDRHWFAPETTTDAHWLHQVVWEPTTAQTTTEDAIRYTAEPTAGDPAAHTHRLVTDLLALAQDQPQRLHVVTRHAHALTPGENTDPAHAALWGFLHTVAAEHPELHLTAVDTDTDSEAPTTTAPFTVIRDGVHHTPKLAPATITGKVDLRRDGHYLVTGGLGALGLRTAGELARRGAGHLVLTSRRDATPEQRAKIADLERTTGATFHIHPGDITDRSTVDELVRVHRPRGIVHAAGVLDDGILAEQTTERFARVLAPKVDAAWHLHEAIKDLDFFVAFSSLAAIVPTFGSGAYAAANAFLTGLMAHRRAKGLPGVAIEWGPWSGIGMAADEDAAHESSGLRMISPDRGARLAVDLATSEIPAVAVVDADWPRLAAASALPPAFFGVEPETRPTGPSLLDEINTATDKTGFLGEQVEKILRDVLGARSELGRQQGFFSMGMDSLMAVEFHARLCAALELRLPPTVVFKHPTLDELVGHLAGELDIAPQGTDTADDDVSAADLVARITQSARAHLD